MAVTLDKERASTQVFRIPELLENILIRIPKPPKVLPTEIAHDRDKTEQPIYQLFTLKRVNCTFKSTIERSILCRQLMHLEFKTGSPSPQDQLDLIAWLCADLNWRASVSNHYLGQLHAARTGGTHSRAAQPGGTVRPLEPIRINMVGEYAFNKKVQDTLAYFHKIESWQRIRFDSSHRCAPAVRIDGQRLGLYRGFPAEEWLRELLPWFMYAVKESLKVYWKLKEKDEQALAALAELSIGWHKKERLMTYGKRKCKWIEENIEEKEPACSQVFRIPELLENILVHLPKPSKRITRTSTTLDTQPVILSRSLRSDEIPREEIPQPLYQLFTLKRVNSTFKSVIESSKECRQLMHLQLISNSFAHRLDMTKWLLDSLAFDVYEHPETSGEMAMQSRGDIFVTKKLRSITRYFSQIGTWRSLECARNGRTLKRRKMMMLGVRVPCWEELGGPGVGADIVYGEMVDLENEAGLGALLDACLVMMDMSWAEHSASREKYCLRVFS